MTKHAPQILIVGDLALSRGLMRMVLTRLNYIVYCVGSAKEAAVAIAHNDFSMALIATRLADGSGLAFSRQLREAGAKERPMPVILFGDTWDQAAMNRDCVDAGIQGFLNKPISISRLVDNVRRWTVPANDSFPPEQERPAVTKTQGPARLTQPIGAQTMEDVIDLNHLNGFTDGDRQLESELASLYISTAQHYISQMRDVLEKGESWDGIAHALKGSSANIGAVKIAQVARRAEHSTPDATLLHEISVELDAVTRFFDGRFVTPQRQANQRTG